MSEKINNRIGQDFGVWDLFKFSLPAFCTNLTTTLFKTMDDGLFVSRYVGETALAGLNILGPLNMIHLGLCHLFSLGSSNISAKKMGEGDQQEAKRVFSRNVVGTLVLGVVMSIIINLFCDEILAFLGADEEIIGYSRTQVRFVFSICALTLTNAVFNNYYATAGKPRMGLYVSIMNGVINVTLDIILIVIMRVGLIGASIATAAGELANFIVGVIFFSNKNNEIHFVNPCGNYIKTIFDGWLISFPQCINSFTISITSYFQNQILLSYLGNNGIAANAIINDLRSILASGFVGYAGCVSPIIAYNYGSKNKARLKKIIYNILKIWFVGGIGITIIGLLLRKPLISIFMNENTSKEFYDITYQGLSIEFFSPLFSSACFIASRMFIALGNSRASTFLAIMRNIVIRMAMLLTLPKLFGVPGIWLVLLVDEILSSMVATFIFFRNADNYGYGKSGIARLMD